MKSCLIVDGREVGFDAGATVMAAARAKGITIPNLCFLEAHETYGSCSLCVVEEEESGRLLISCTTRAEPNMQIRTNTEKVRAARRTALELLFSEHVGDCEAPCRLACPAGLDIARIMELLATGNLESARVMVKEKLPLAAALCRACKAPCEAACRRSKIDGSVSIREVILELAPELQTEDERVSMGEAADRFLKDRRKQKRRKQFISRIGRLDGVELESLANAASTPSATDKKTLCEPEKEALRCLLCACFDRETCELRHYAEAYEVDSRRFRVEGRGRVERRVSGAVVHEPGKCIRCARCVRICEEKNAPAGMTVHQRGYEMRIDTPFGANLDTALDGARDLCVKSCPTGALAEFRGAVAEEREALSGTGTGTGTGTGNHCLVERVNGDGDLRRQE